MQAHTFLSFRMRWMGATTVIGALLLAVSVALSGGTATEAIGSAAGASSTTATEKVGSSLSSLAADSPARRAEVIVRMAPGEGTASARRLVEGLGGKATTKDIDIINGFGAELRAADAARLARDPRVEAVSLNGRVESRAIDMGGYEWVLRDRRYSFLEGVLASAEAPRRYDLPAGCPGADASTVSLAGWPLRHNNTLTDVGESLRRLGGVQHHAIGADRAWERATGKGVGVAVIDTGIAGDLPDFRRSATSRNSRVVASAVTNPCAKEAGDNYGHGTHVAGLIAGNGLALQSDDPSYGKYMGIAPAADLVSVKVSDDDGNSSVLDVIYGLQFAVDHKADFNIRVINMSLSATVAESYRTDPLDAAVEQAWNRGIVVVAAAGNEGAAENAVDFAPGNDPHVITVGAVDDRNTRTVSDDVLAPWSSRGVTQDGRRKPEVLAPGTSMTAALAPNSDFHRARPELATGPNRYFRMGGTSMSAAVVSGAVALILEEHPEWTPNQVKGALMSTLVDVPGAGGEVNVAAALSARHLSSNEGLEQSTLIDPATGELDWARASFRRASFRDASGGDLAAAWSRASFRCACSLIADGDEVDPARASFRRASFRRTAEFDK